MQFSQVWNPLFLVTGLLLVTYMWMVGSCLKTYFSKYRHGAITLGFFATMFLFGICFVWFRFANANYKGFFIAFLLITFGFSLFRVITKKMIPDKTYIIQISSMLILTLMVTTVMSKWPQHLHIDSDFWLYGRFLTNGSNFIGVDIPGNIYQLSNFHDFIGSFIGLISGPITDFKDAHYPISVISYQVQVPMVMLLVAILVEAVNSFNKGKLFVLIGYLLIQTLFPFRTGLIGSFMLFLPFALLLSDIMENKFNSNVTIIYFIPFMFFVSSISFLLPFVLVLAIVIDGKISLRNGLILSAVSGLFIFNRENGNITYDMELILITGLMLFVVTMQKYLFRLFEIVFSFATKHQLLVFLVFIACVFSFIFTLKMEYEYINHLMAFVRRPIYAIFSIFAFIRISKRNTNIFKYLIVSLIFINPAINIISNVFDVFQRVHTIYHRVGNIALFGEIYMNIGSIVIVPLAIIELINFVKERKNDQLHNSPLK